MKCELKLMKRDVKEYCKHLSIYFITLMIIFAIVWWYFIVDWIPLYVGYAIVAILPIEICIWYYKVWKRCKK